MAVPNKKKNPAAARPAAAKKVPTPRTAAEKVPPALTHTFAPDFWRMHWLPMLVLFGLSMALYAASIGFGYVLDDEMVIGKNNYVQQGIAGWPAIFAHDSFMGYFQQQIFLLEGGRYRPLSLATFALEISLFGKDQSGIAHAINVALYGVNVLVLYRILLGLFPIRPGGQWYGSAAFLGAALFALHPLHVECVANIKGRDEILALTFSLLALYAALKYFDRPHIGYLILTGVSLLLGMLAKENALTFVAVIPLTIWFFAKVPPARQAGLILTLGLAALLFIAIRYNALGYMLSKGKPSTDLMNNPFLNMSSGERLATIFMTLGWYIKLLFVPHPLTHDYYPYHVPKVGWTDWRALLSLAGYIGVTVWALLNLRRRAVAAYGVLFFLLTLSIVSNLLVSVGTFMNERFIYMPSVAWCLLGGWLLARQLPAWSGGDADRLGIAGAAIFALVAGLFAWRTVTRVPDWANRLALNTSAVRNSPNSARSHCFYTTALYQDVYEKTQDPAEKRRLLDTMEYHLQRAIAINPRYVSAWSMVPAIAAAQYTLDGDFSKVLGEFERTLDNISSNSTTLEYIAKYIAYYAKSSARAAALNDFCYRVGYQKLYKAEKEPQRALKIMEGALAIADARLFGALAEVYAATGNAGKAAEMQARATAVQ
jgi:protein O-mannosyl-transferase